MIPVKLNLINSLTIVFTLSFRQKPESPAKAGLQRDFWMPDRVRHDGNVNTITRQLINLDFHVTTLPSLHIFVNQVLRKSPLQDSPYHPFPSVTEGGQDKTPDGRPYPGAPSGGLRQLPAQDRFPVRIHRFRVQR